MSEKVSSVKIEKREKVLSPGTLIRKRFCRNKLALVGVAIIVSMFAFSFIGGIVSPYGQAQVFRKMEITYKDYAGVAENTEFIFTETKQGSTSPMLKADTILAITTGESIINSEGKKYSLLKLGDEFYQVATLKEVASVLSIRGKNTVSVKGNVGDQEAFKTAFNTAQTAGNQSFTAGNATYYIQNSGRMSTICSADVVANISKLLFNAYASDTVLTNEFKVAAESAMVNGASSFDVDGKNFTVEKGESEGSALFKLDGTEYASASKFSVQPVGDGLFLSIPFKKAVEEAVKAGEKEFSFTGEDGKEEVYKVTNKNLQYTIKKQKAIQVNNSYEAPSKKHWAGTDGNGMDMLTRLMYGGRISLLIGFVVVFFEIILGIIIGGISGYFGGWVDSVCMRIVDVFNCIPSLPLYIILGAIMDYLKVEPRLRIYFLCIILAALSWPSVARMVRGQILSLREQEFMIATEATGIRTSRRIFKHLIPNVIPQLIVIATMGLGNVILVEASLSFLGLGVKYPLASWGNIVNAVNDIYIMTNYTFVWIPAGMLILITVLGFNFIGDGLRDAFDPKMKR